jgi:hypothetical protein
MNRMTGRDGTGKPKTGCASLAGMSPTPRPMAWNFAPQVQAGLWTAAPKKVPGAARFGVKIEPRYR